MSAQTTIPMIKKPLATALTILLALTLLLALVAPAMAQQNANAADEGGSNAPTQGQGPTDPAELEAFLDELMPNDMAEHHIPGAAVAVVKDGKLFFSKGYGYADLANKIPVDPEQTVFKTGSAGKLFTWTAVMQLVEQGKLDLDADVNSYLDFRIPATYPQAITLKHLLTHTPGFEELWSDVFVWKAADLVPVGEWLAAHIPARVRPPGEVAAYSNYGTLLAGYIVARASGQPYEQYLQEHIFDPLGMVHSSAQWPLPSDHHASVALGYWDIGAGLQPVPDYPQYMGQPAMAPAGGHSSSATDMARFMIAHLQGGRYSDAVITEGRILKESTVQQMHSTLYTPDPRILGNAYGFFDFSDNGQRTLGHSGDTIGFATLLLLLPDQKLGLFVAYNNEAVGGLNTQHVGFQRAFFDHYYPAPAVAPIQPAADLAARVSRFAGSYKITRSAYQGFEKIGNLFSPLVEIRDLGNGTLLFNDHGFEARLVAVEPLYFRQPDGPLGVVFRENDRGRITQMFADVAPQYAYERLSWYEMPRFNMALLLGCVLLFLSMIPVVAARALWNRRGGKERKPASGGAHIAYWLLFGLGVLNLLVVVGVVRMWLFSLGFPRFGLSSIDRIVLALGVVSAVLTIGALVYTVLAWLKGYWGVAFRAYYTLVAVTAVAFVWFLSFWNQLGWRF